MHSAKKKKKLFCSHFLKTDFVDRKTLSSWHEAFKIRRSGYKTDRKEKNLTPRSRPRTGSDCSTDSSRGREKESKAMKLANKVRQSIV